ncbi:putative disease resistance RPP13-like protein 1 [Ziziphus jujuba]|uniref:Disease resistance RPP13-like protein 1 n=1 Tax=Ziziphus jujuba TaxID=326968 RepID=A0ABM3ZYD4_ZIZJJ|nr:putative disease resistance RPP13-like protein 1 [Ziziphus jujuba]
MKKKLEKILRRFKVFEKSINILGLTNKGVGEKPSPRPPTTSLIEESEFYGRNGDKEAIIKLLLKDDYKGSNKVCVIPIVGMGGIGETTLAQSVYNNHKVQRHFNLRSWVYVSEEFDIFKGLRSKIIATTRSENVAKIMSTIPTHYQLKHLKDEDCWRLFKKHAFDNIKDDCSQSKINKRVEDVGDEYFNELVSTSFLQRSSGQELFGMHDLVHDLAKYVSRGHCIISNDDSSKDSIANVHHASVRYMRYDSIFTEATCSATLELKDRKNLLVEMPRQMSKLKSLQTLIDFIIGKDNGTNIGELRELSDLHGQLFLKNLENVANASDASDAKLVDRKYLEALHLDWKGDDNDKKK